MNNQKFCSVYIICPKINLKGFLFTFLAKKMYILCFGAGVRFSESLGKPRDANKRSQSLAW